MLKIDLEAPAVLFGITFTGAVGVSALFTPLCRWCAVRWGVLDHPRTPIKTHETPTPYLGGVAIFAGFVSALLLVRFLTNFPTGTLHALRGILFGGTLIFLAGLIDDLKAGGLGFKEKFAVQIIAALCLIAFDIRIKFVHPPWFAILVSVIWIVGVTNAFNIVDIMDGLSGGVAFIASLTFLVIALPTEALYVDLAAAALAGACLGFLPYNLSKKRKIFMGDAGSLLLGFVLAALSLGTSYTTINNIGVLAPVLILGLPLYDTALVMYCRVRQKQSPFLGSKDHFALRLEAAGFFRPEILVIAYAASLGLSVGAFLVTRVSWEIALPIYGVIGGLSWLMGVKLSRMPSD